MLRGLRNFMMMFLPKGPQTGSKPI
jgi:hypothetical protein